MKFFSPDLYLKFNSADDVVADAADQAWEKVMDDYRQHLERLQEKMPSPVRKLSQLCLHDAEILAWNVEVNPIGQLPLGRELEYPLWLGVAILSVQQPDDLTSLFYFLSDRPITATAPVDWPFSSQRKHWLYDEIDVGRPNGFRHRILFSDGSSLDIPFVTVITHTFPLPKSTQGGTTRKTA